MLGLPAQRWRQVDDVGVLGVRDRDVLGDHDDVLGLLEPGAGGVHQVLEVGLVGGVAGVADMAPQAIAVALALVHPLQDAPVDRLGLLLRRILPCEDL